MPGTKPQKHSVAVAIDRAALRETVAATLEQSDRYEISAVADCPAVAVVTDVTGLRSRSGEFVRRRADGCPVVVVLADTDSPRMVADVAEMDAYVSERELNRLLPSAILLSAFGLGPVPARVASMLWDG